MLSREDVTLSTTGKPYAFKDRFWRRYVNGGSGIWRVLFEVCDSGGRLWRVAMQVGGKSMTDEPPVTKLMVAAVVIKLVAMLILLFALLQIAYVGERAISEAYDIETVDVVQAAFYLGVLIGVVAMMAIEAARSVMGVAVELCVDGLKYVRDHITGAKRKQATQPDWTDKAFGLNRIHGDEQDSRLR